MSRKIKKSQRCTICHQRKDDALIARPGGGLAHDTCLRAFDDRRRVASVRKDLP